MEKVGNLLKDAIDYVAHHSMDTSGVRIYGAVVISKYRDDVLCIALSLSLSHECTLILALVLFLGDQATSYSMELTASGIYLMKRYGDLCAPRISVWTKVSFQTLQKVERTGIAIDYIAKYPLHSSSGTWSTKKGISHMDK